MQWHNIGRQRCWVRGHLCRPGQLDSDHCGTDHRFGMQQSCSSTMQQSGREEDGYGESIDGQFSSANFIWETIYIIYTRSYATLRAADLDWIVGPGYSLGRVHSGEKPWKANLEPWKTMETNQKPWKTLKLRDVTYTGQFIYFSYLFCIFQIILLPNILCFIQS